MPLKVVGVQPEEIPEQFVGANERRQISPAVAELASMGLEGALYFFATNDASSGKPAPVHHAVEEDRRQKSGLREISFGPRPAPETGNGRGRARAPGAVTGSEVPQGHAREEIRRTVARHLVGRV